ncbi:MAG: DJ-1/PfpI family protein [Flavobacteriaceae bacterium]
MGSVKDFFGIQPKSTGDEPKVYTPSDTALKMTVNARTNYDNTFYNVASTSTNLKILIIATEQDCLEMANGKQFLTGNNPIEIFVPMLHWQRAGFKFDFATVNGKPVKLEHWAMPGQDENVADIYNGYKDKLETPLSLKDIANTLAKTNYFAVYIPGGHGVLSDLPFSTALKKVLFWAVANNKYIIASCHGPAALLAASIDENDKDFLFKGYQIVAFPDGTDKILPNLGYLPGQLSWFFGKALESLGVEIVNKIPVGRVYQDLKLITADSPMAANKLGRISSELLLEDIS